MARSETQRSSPSWRLWGLLAAVIGVIAAVLAIHNQAMIARTMMALSAIDDPLERFNLEQFKLEKLLPRELQDHIDNLITRTGKWTETLDFQVGRQLAEDGAKADMPVILLPGVITTGLESWTTTDSELVYFRRRLWGSMAMVRSALFNRDEWVRHLMLDPVTGLDPEGIRVRAAKGLDAASYFAAGYWVWSKIIENLAAVGYDINQIYLAGYDWRLSMSNLQVRDHFYSELKSRIQLNKEIFGKKTVLISHSMGGTVGFYFLKWAEHNLGARWVDDHIDSFVNIAGTMLGLPKAMAALMTGEMRDTVQVPSMLSYLLERHFSSQERAQLFRSWAGSASMLLKGGNDVWGDETGAPDDFDNATSTHGVLMSYADRPGLNASEGGRRLTVDEANPWLRMHTPKEFQEMLHTNYSHGIERNPKQLKKNNADPTKWVNPLEVPLPNAPNMKVYCVYGYNQPTERSYWMRDMSSVNPQSQYDMADIPATWTSVNQTSPVVPPLSRIDASVNRDEVPEVSAGCRLGEGDGTVSLLSLGAMCVEGWKLPRYNPAKIPIITHEVHHDPEAFDLRGGTSSGDHIDILGSHALNRVVVNVAAGRGHLVEENILSPIKKYAAKIKW